jgi:hypothetical protein
MSNKMSRALRVTSVAVVVAAGTPLLLTGVAKGASTPVSFAATASADPVRVLSNFPNFPATASPIDSGGPTAQVSLSTSTGGVAFAAAPDPGSFFLSLPTIGAGVAAQNNFPLPFNVPAYPFSVRADEQTPSQRVGSGGYDLRAEVGGSGSTARTQTGAESPGGNYALTTADAAVTKTADGVETKALSDIQGLTIGPLTFGGIRSEATLLSDEMGTLTRKSAFSVDAMRIGTLAVGLAPGGFTVAGQPVSSNDQKNLNDLLAASGISLEQFPATETADGIIGAGLVITQKFDSPSLGASTLTYRIGGVAARLQASAPGAVAPAGTTPATGVPGTTAPSAGADLAAVLPSLGATAPGALPGTSLTPASAPTTGLDTVLMQPATVSQLVTSDSNALYLALVIAGVLGLAVTRLLKASE